MFFYSELGLASEDRRNILIPLLMVGHWRVARQMEGHTKASRVEQSLLRLLEGLGMMLKLEDVLEQARVLQGAQVLQDGAIESDGATGILASQIWAHLLGLLQKF